MRLVQVRPSSSSTKKLMAIFDAGGKTKTVHFGARGYGDFINYFAHNPQLARRKRSQYIARHSVTEPWRDPTAPGTLARYILWEKPTLEQAVRAYRRRFRV